VRLPAVDTEGQSFIEVRDREGEDVVAVIELLSPSNKRPGPDREQYLGKRAALLRTPAHLVEIDLLRAGPRMPMDGLPACDYCVMVSRAESRPHADLWPIGLRDTLPPVPVPLRGGDPDARLDLQTIVHRVYDAAGYVKMIYRRPPEPPLSSTDAAWARRAASLPDPA
jgi:hypothetical protein